MLFDFIHNMTHFGPDDSIATGSHKTCFDANPGTIEARFYSAPGIESEKFSAIWKDIKDNWHNELNPNGPQLKFRKINCISKTGRATESCELCKGVDDFPKVRMYRDTKRYVEFKPGEKDLETSLYDFIETNKNLSLEEK